MAGRSRVFWAGPVSKTSSFSGLLSSSMVVSIRDLLGRDGFGGACLHRDFSFFPCNFIFSSSPLVACGWSSLNGAGLISLIKIGLLQSSRGGGGKNTAASGLFFPPPPPWPCHQSRETRPGSGIAFLLLRDSPQFGVCRSKPVCFYFKA